MNTKTNFRIFHRKTLTGLALETQLYPPERVFISVYFQQHDMEFFVRGVISVEFQVNKFRRSVIFCRFAACESPREPTELLLNCLAGLNNITYYIHPESPVAVLAKQYNVAECELLFTISIS